MNGTRQCDLAIVGGGLAGGLIALALAKHRPEARVLLIEGSDRLGGAHIWSFFESDIAPDDRPLLVPLVAHWWDGYDAAFPGHRRTLSARYHSITSERFERVLRHTLPAERILTGRRALGVGAHSVVLADGTRIDARGVIDARGRRISRSSIAAGRPSSARNCGWRRRMG